MRRAGRGSYRVPPSDPGCGMHVMVTGGSGFVGSAVVRRLLSAGYDVRVFVRRTSDLRNLDGLDVHIVYGDLRDPTTFDLALRDCDGLFHVAADYRLWVRHPQQMFTVNVESTRALIEAALRAGLQRIVYTSSVATLGLSERGPACEDLPVTYEDMIGPYKQSKFLAEQAVLRLVRDYAAPVVIVNPTTPMGRGDIKPTPTGKIIADALSGRMPAYVDTGLNIVHVDDVAEGHLLAYDRGRVGERYILGSENMFLADILKEVARLAGRKPPAIRLPHAAVMPIALVCEAWARLANREPIVCADGVRLARKHMFFSSRKACQELGYRPRPAPEALRDAVAYFREWLGERRASGSERTARSGEDRNVSSLIMSGSLTGNSNLVGEKALPRKGKHVASAAMTGKGTLRYTICGQQRGNGGIRA